MNRIGCSWSRALPVRARWHDTLDLDVIPVPPVKQQEQLAVRWIDVGIRNRALSEDRISVQGVAIDPDAAVLCLGCREYLRVWHRTGALPSLLKDPFSIVQRGFAPGNGHAPRARSSISRDWRSRCFTASIYCSASALERAGRVSARASSSDVRNMAV